MELRDWGYSGNPICFLGAGGGFHRDATGTQEQFSWEFGPKSEIGDFRENSVNFLEIVDFRENSFNFLEIVDFR